MSEPDEFEKFLRHAEFAKVLELASKLKAQKSRLVTFADPETNEAISTSPPSLTLRAPRRKASRLENPEPEFHDLTDDSPKQRVGTRADFVGARPRSRRGGARESHHTPPNIENAAHLIRSALIPSTEDDSFDNAEGMTPNTIGRGEYPITDSLIDETIKSLADELRYCLELKMQLREVSESRHISPSSTDDRGSPLAAKFSKWQTDILTEWMIEHREHPFPTQSETAQLARVTGLSEEQVLTWATNARKRHLKMMVDRERKPRDFLDYLFLATDREKQIMRDNPNKSLSFQDERSNIPDALLLASMPLKQATTITATHSAETPKRSTQRSSQKGFKTDPPRYSYPRPPSSHHSELRPSTSMPSADTSRLPLAPPRPASAYKSQYQPQEQPSYAARYPAGPYKRTTPKNADHIFRRGKQFHHLTQGTTPTGKRGSTQALSGPLETSHMPELPLLSWSFGSENERDSKFRSTEQRLIQKYTPNGIIETPEGSLDDDDSFDLGGIDENIFEQYYIPPLTHEHIVDITSLESFTHENPSMLYRGDGFKVEDILDVPYDESEKDYLSGLL